LKIPRHFYRVRNTGDDGATGINFSTSTGSVRAQVKYTPLTTSEGVVQILEGTGSNNGLFSIDGPGAANSGNNIRINEDEPRGRLHICSNSQLTNPRSGTSNIKQMILTLMLTLRLMLQILEM
jgi:hypothetical protein